MKHTDDIRLNKCLHCGGKAELLPSEGGWVVDCMVCGICTAKERDADKAIKVWNRSAVRPRRRSAAFLEDLTS